MTSEKQIEANRQNALKSTGPKTPEGKAISKMNRYEFGAYTDNFALTKDEDPEEYSVFRDILMAEHMPQGLTETLVANTIVQRLWVLRRLMLQQSQVTHDHFHRDTMMAEVGYYLTLSHREERAIIRMEKFLRTLQTEREAGQRKAVLVENLVSPEDFSEEDIEFIQNLPGQTFPDLPSSYGAERRVIQSRIRREMEHEYHRSLYKLVDNEMSLRDETAKRLKNQTTEGMQNPGFRPGDPPATQ